MVSRFNTGAASAAPATQATARPVAQAAQAAGPRKSKYEGVMAAGDSEPPLWPAWHEQGAYLVEILETVDDFGAGSDDSSFKAKGRILEIDPDNAEANAHHKIGDVVFLHIGMTSGKGMKPGLQRAKRFTMVAAGYEVEAEFMATLGNAFLDGAGRNENLVGRQIAVNSKRGADDPNGKARYGFYVEYSWIVAGDKIVQAEAPF